MTLALHGEEDHNGNAFPVSSSSSSASSSCCSSRMGESSPESLRSLSSLSGERTRSPLDYDMLEVTVVATIATPQEKSSTADDVSAGRTQAAAETTESNDNSVSVYLDANSEYHHELWNDNDNDGRTLALDTSSSGDSGGHRDVDNRWPDSSCPDSDATEIPVDDDDEEEDEEVLFLSVSSDTGLCKSSVTPAGSTGADGFSSVAIPVDEGSEVVLAEVEDPSKEDHRPEAPASDDHVKVFNTPSPSPGQAQLPPLEGAISQQDQAPKAECAPPSLPAKAASSQEAGKNSQKDQKLVQHKGGSRPSPSPCKTPTQV